MKRRILTCLLVLCMILALVPMMAVATGAEDDGIVATVTANGKTVLQATTLSDAFAAAAKRSGATVVLMDDVTVTAGFDFAGTYTFDLNGHTISAHTPLLQTRGTVTIIDSSEGQTGVIRGEGCPALRLAGVTYTLEDEEGNVTTNYDGNIVLKSGTFDATDCDYGVYNSGKGVLYLTGTPKLAKGIYLAYSDSLCGTDKPVANAEQAPALYEGDVVSVYYAEDPIPENALLLQNGDTSKFDFAQRGYYTAQAIDGTYVFSKWGYLSFAFSALIAFIILVIVLALVIKVARTKKKIAKMQIFSIPAFLPFMAAMGDMWRLVLVALVALLLITIVLSIVIRSSMKKKLKAATKAYKARLKKEAANAAVAAAAEAVVEEAPVEEAPAEEAPAEEVAVEETPVEEAPAEEAPVEEAPAEEAPVEEAPAEEAPAEETPDEETPDEEAPVEEAPTEEAPAEE
ncbi:MAG: hypothetical protein J6U87_06065, partial [Clostridia bacterium]|nr:hypothetical protein [Clostridia bacterium]